MAYKKYKGLDMREVKCCDTSKNTIEAGISFDKNCDGIDILRFHFLENLELSSGKKLLQVTIKDMYLNEKSIRQLIEILQDLLNDK